MSSLCFSSSHHSSSYWLCAAPTILNIAPKMDMIMVSSLGSRSFGLGPGKPNPHYKCIWYCDERNIRGNPCICSL
ncbi:hypothetical protein ISN44_As05g022180 [Arabidopsis suecica]|uniref:Uncharacterized protein n=1 Tax=Arabidopsis suecica TaxID=45249 RepID=A0A8T2DFJ8_ARASU|nr:hypothetical protein ISN44_As05g022180 [Arabidopsis suecica]